jgi:hypothetical protein
MGFLRLQRLSAFLLIAALLGNSFAPLATASPDQRELTGARAELAALFGGAIAFCTTGAGEDGPGSPPAHADSTCILCCLPQPLRFAAAVTPPLLPLPAPVQLAAPWPVLRSLTRTPDPAPPPYRPRDPPSFG